ncbi:LysR family transcriptional regulator [uncultured Shimia sp.]|uniref:LysR family transcriptional regulator n=1 Tax=uncultured Shimia sp. TaxID=573152 RepID=UPI0025CD3F2B|nr:LysR family transcriptional regulator [uncultured Shimia sp.]
MDTHILKLALLVQAQGSIAGAARTLDLDPSSVSRSLSALEAELGVRLFHRTTRKLSTTEEGAAYLRRVGPLVEEMQAAAQEAVGTQHQPSGTLRITASVAFACQRIVPLLPAFSERYPEISVEVISSDANLDLVEQGIDLAVRLAPAPKGDLVSRKLMDTRYHLVASPAYLERSGDLETPEGLRDHDCLRYALPEIGDVWRFRKEGTASFEVSVTGRHRFSNALALLEAGRQGLGVGLLADWLVTQDLTEGGLVELCPQYQGTVSGFETAAWLLYPNRRYLPRKTRVMIDFLRERLAR